MSKFTTFLLVLLLLLVAVPAGLAQEDSSNPNLSAEDLELLERGIAATTRDISEFSTQFTRSISSEQIQETQVSLGEQTQMERELTNLELSMNVILGDAPNIQANFVVNYESATDAEEVTSYVMEAEVRRVGDELYVNAKYVESEGDVPALPEGWVMIDDPANFPEFEVLDLDDFSYEYLDLDDPEEASDEEFAELLRQYATSVTLESAEVNGETVDVVLVSLNYEGLREVLLQNDTVTPDDPFLTLFDTMLADSQEDLVTVSVGIDSEGRAVTGINNLSMSLPNIDLASMFPGEVPEGAMMTLDMVQMQEYVVQYNTEFAPVEAPELP